MGFAQPKVHSIDRTQLCALLLWVSFGLTACNGPLIGHPSYVDGYTTFADSSDRADRADRADRDWVNVVVEIPAGTNDKWEVDKSSGSLHWEQKDGKPRVVQYLAYPANYGMIPRTSLPYEIGGDGDPLDVLLLGPELARGAVVQARPIGVLHLIDDDERDDKILAVPVAGPLSDVTDLAALDARYPGIRQIVETWFTHYKGPGRTTSAGFGDAVEAVAVVREANRYYESKPGRAE